MSEEKTLTFKVESFRRIPNPYQQKATKTEDEYFPQMYFAICDVKNLPSDIPMETNPRDQSMGKAVVKKIKQSLLDTADSVFYLLNRGMVISAKSVHYDNNSGNMTIVFEDLDVHGDIDGGHTYKSILEKRDQLNVGDQYVKLEILTGVEDMFQSLAAARNTSTQVEDKSIAELEDRFDLIKDAIKNEPFCNSVYFKENAPGDIDVADIISLLTMFNLDKFPDITSFPTMAYSGKKKCIDYYIAAHKESGETGANPYYKMKSIMVDIFKLYDTLEVKIGEYYKQKNPGGRFGLIKGVAASKSGLQYKSRFYGNDLDYQTATGLLYPIIGSLRALVKEENGHYAWKTNPFAMLEKVGNDLVDTTVERSRSLGNNPQSVGKDTGNWKTLYMTVALALTM